MSRRRAIWILLIIVVIGVGIRAWEVTARSLWFDEAFSWRLIQFPLPEMLTRAQADVHPALYYVLLQGWSVVFGSSLASLRGFSVTLGGAGVALGYLFAASAFRSRQVGLLSALLLALAGFQIQYAWEARMYTLGTALGLLTAWLLLKALRARTKAVYWWLAYGVSTAAFAQVHYYALFSIIAAIVFLVGYVIVSTRARIGEMLQWRLTWYVVGAWGVAFALCAPWIPVFLRQNAQVQDAFWIPPLTAWSIPDTFYRMLVPLVGFPRHDSVGYVIVALLPLAGIVITWLLLLVPSFQARFVRDGTWLTVLLGVIPFLLSSAASFLGRSVYQDRYFVFAHVFIMIAIAAAVWRIRWPSVRAAFIVFIVVGLSFADAAYWKELDVAHKPGAHGAAELIYTKRAGDEPVLVSSPFVYFAIDHYAHEEFHSTDLPKLYALAGSIIHFAGGPILTPQDTVGQNFFDAQTLTSFWMVDTTGFGAQPLAVPSLWRAGETARFPEVYGYQGEVLVTHYRR